MLTPDLDGLERAGAYRALLARLDELDAELIDDRALALVSARRVRPLRLLGQVTAAADLARALIPRVRAAGWSESLGEALRERAACMLQLGDAAAASHLAEEARDVAEQAGDLGALGLALLVLGDARARWLDPARAVELWESAAATLRVAGADAPLGTTLTRLGEQHQREGRLADARATCEEALALARGDVFAEAGARWSLAMVLEEQAGAARDVVKSTGGSSVPGPRAAGSESADKTAISPASYAEPPSRAARPGGPTERDGTEPPQSLADRACHELEHALLLWRRAGHLHGVGRALNALGEHARRAGRLAEADARYAEAQALGLVDDPLAAAYRLNRALVALAAGDVEGALAGAEGHELAADPTYPAAAAAIRMATGVRTIGPRTWDAAERAVRYAVEERGVVDRDLAECLLRAGADPDDPDRAARATDLALGQLRLRGDPREVLAARRRLQALGDQGATIPLGAWLLRHPLAAGAAGEVWEAVHRDRATRVAVKLLPEDVLASPALRATLATELRAVAALNHPNVVAVLDQGRVGQGAESMTRGRLAAGSPYLVMELAHGGNLLPLCGRVGWLDARAILDALLSALAAAHARGLVHRDLKPDNVLVEHPDDLRPGFKLTDFGLALAVGEADARVAGTPAYMAPEQCRGAWRAIGPWTDLYALGCTAWTLLTGAPPFDGEDLRDILRRQVREEPGPFRPTRPVPSGTEAWLRRLLAKAPSDRFAYAVEARIGLRALEGRARSVADGRREPASAPSRSGVPAAAGELDEPAAPGGRADLAADRESGEPRRFPPSAEPDRQTDSPSLSEAPTQDWPPTPPVGSERDPAPPPEGWDWSPTFHASAGPLAGQPGHPSRGGLGQPSSRSVRLAVPRADLPAGARPAATIHAAPPEWAEPDTPFPRALAGLDTWVLREIPLVGRVAERDRLWSLLAESGETRRPRMAVIHGPPGSGRTRLAEWIRVRAQELVAAEVLTVDDGDLVGAFARAWRLRGLTEDGDARWVGRAGSPRDTQILSGRSRPGAASDRAAAGAGAVRPPRTGARPLGSGETAGSSAPDGPGETAISQVPSPAPGRGSETTPRTDPRGSHDEPFASPNRTALAAAVTAAGLEGDLAAAVLGLFGETPVSRGERCAVVAAALRTLARGRPVVVTFDGGPPGTAELAQELFERGDGWLLVVLVAAEPRLGRAAAVELGPLADEELQALIQSRLPLEEGLARTLARRSAGSPGTATALLDHLLRTRALEPRGDGLALRAGVTLELPPPDARWDDRLAACAREGATTSLEILAVLGGATSEEWVAARDAAGVVPPPDVEDVLAGLGLVQVRRGRWELVDPRLSHRVTHLGVSRESAFNLACSTVIQEPGRQGLHLLRAGRIDDGADRLVEAAEGAEDQGELHEAFDLAKEALDALERLPAPPEDARRARLGVLLARVQIDLGRPEGALQSAATVLAGAGRAGWERAVAEAQRCRARVLRTQGRLREAEEAFTAALAAAEALPDPALAGHARLGLALVYRSRGHLDAALSTLEEAARNLPVGEQGQVELTIGAIRMQQGALTEARAWLERAVRSQEHAGRAALAQAINVLAEVDRREGDFDAAEVGYRQALRLLELAGARAQAVFPRLNLALLWFTRERWREARGALLDVLADVEDQGREGLAGACHAMLLAPAVALGDSEAFEHHAGLALDKLRRTGFREPDTRSSLRLALALTTDARQERWCRELLATQE